MEPKIPEHFVKSCESDVDDGNICPKCFSDDIDYFDEEWSATTNTETLYYRCMKCKAVFAVETVYRPISKKYLW